MDNSYDIVVTDAIEARKVNLNHIFFSPHNKGWEVYVPMNKGEPRQWHPVENFRMGMRVLVAEADGMFPEPVKPVLQS